MVELSLTKLGSMENHIGNQHQPIDPTYFGSNWRQKCYETSIPQSSDNTKDDTTKDDDTEDEGNVPPPEMDDVPCVPPSQPQLGHPKNGFRTKTQWFNVNTQLFKTLHNKCVNSEQEAVTMHGILQCISHYWDKHKQLDTLLQMLTRALVTDPEVTFINASSTAVVTEPPVIVKAGRPSVKRKRNVLEHQPLRVCGDCGLAGHKASSKSCKHSEKRSKVSTEEMQRAPPFQTLPTINDSGKANIVNTLDGYNRITMVAYDAELDLVLVEAIQRQEAIRLLVKSSVIKTWHKGKKRVFIER